MIRRFEFVGGTSAKFWEVAISGASVTVRFGQLGTNGQSQTTQFPDVAKAQKHVEKLVREKVSKGYCEVAAV